MFVGGCMNNERGIIMAILLVTAVLFMTASFAILAVSISRISVVKKAYDRYQSQFVAEAGLVWAIQQLWVDPDFCTSTDTVILNGRTATVIMSDCGTSLVTISSVVTY